MCSFIEIQPTSVGSQTSFAHDDSARDLLGFDLIVIIEKLILSPDPIDILYFDNIYLEGGITEGMIFEGRRSGILHNLTKDVGAGNK